MPLGFWGFGAPGGGTPSSLRRRPLEPPSSVTVTIPVSREMKGGMARAWPSRKEEADDVALEPAQQGGQAGAASDGDNPEAF